MPYLQTDSLRLHYREAGPTAGEPAFVLLHGLASTLHIWDLVTPYLSAQHRVLALDQRGHGLSDKPASGYDFASFTADLSTALAQLKVGKAILVGHSWGGNVALQFAAENPQRVHALGLLEGGFVDLQSAGMTWDQAELNLAPPQLAGTPRAAFLERARSWALAPYWSPEIQAIVMANFEVLPDDTILPRLSRELHMQIVRSMWEQRPTLLFTRIACRTFLMPARRETQDPRESAFRARKLDGVAEARRLIPHVEVRWFDDSIHDVPLQRPRELAEALLELEGSPRRKPRT